MASLQVLYGDVMRNAVATKDLKKMKATASQAAKQIRDLQAGLTRLQGAIAKLDKK
jgi:hypothetical protein